ncbi:MAG TPA: T9SS type A sorting domain-containing protein [Candidatus Acidoferrales bacterium]|nr:T9SS type A sorting domain-containing protein [Candidatus Acidoferrales bacterium]
MRHFIWALLFAAAMIPVSLYAQTDTLDVPPDGASGGNLDHAIDSVISAGTLSNTVFRLVPSGFGYGQDYVLNGIVTTPVHQKLTIIAPDPTPTSPPPQIVMQTGNGVTWTQNFDCFGDLYMKNIWMMYVNTSGTQNGAGIFIEDDSIANNSGEGEHAYFENCIFDLQKTSANGCINPECQHFRGTFKNCYFRNDVDNYFIYYGRAISWQFGDTKWHTDSLSFENCTFANMGYVLMNEKPCYSDYVWLNHCTFLNICCFPLEGDVWHWLDVTNCIFVNTWMYGDNMSATYSRFSRAAGTNPIGAILQVDSLAASNYSQGTDAVTFPYTDADRHILFANNSFYEEKWLTDFWFSNPVTVNPASDTSQPRPQPMMNLPARQMFGNDSLGNKRFPYINLANLYPSDDTSYNASIANPNFNLPPTQVDSIEGFLDGRYFTSAQINWAYNQGSDDKNGAWPMSEDLSYDTKSALYTAGIGGFPLGDLYHWWGPNSSTGIDQYTPWKAQAAGEDSVILHALTTGDLTGIMAGVKSRPGTPESYVLSQNYPNPFNPSTTIEYSVPRNGFVTLKVYNILGQEVSTLFSGVQHAGNYQATFDGAKFASGVYFYRLQAGNVSITKKLVLIK